MSYEKIKKTVHDSMEKTVQWLHDEYKIIRTGRATPALLDNVRVEAWGERQPLKNVANISIPEPRCLMIKPFDVSLLKAIEKGVLESDLGITPTSDGKAVRLTLPALSEEQRKKLAGSLKDHAEKARIAIRNTRRDGNKDADNALKKDKTITEDECERLKTEIQNMTKDYEKKVDDQVQKKTEEVMEI